MAREPRCILGLAASLALFSVAVAPVKIPLSLRLLLLGGSSTAAGTVAWISRPNGEWAGEEKLESLAKTQQHHQLAAKLAWQDQLEELKREQQIKLLIGGDQPQQPQPVVQQVAIDPDKAPYIESVEKALKQIKVPGRVIDVCLGASLVQVNVKLRNSTHWGTLNQQQKALQLELGLPTPPTFGIEQGGEVTITIPRKDRQSLFFEDHVHAHSDENLRLVIGVDVRGNLIEAPLNTNELESFLVGGMPKVGKSSWIKSMLASLIFRYPPQRISFVIGDGKGGVEFGFLSESPYLLKPVATTAKDASDLLKWLKQFTDERYKKFFEAGVNNLDDYNKQQPLKLPYVLASFDEFQDLFDFKPKRGEDTPDYENASSIASRGRAAGIIVVFSTQKPDRKLLPGQIDGKLGSRVCLAVQRDGDSEVILNGDPQGACLRPHGDLLFKAAGCEPVRLQGLIIKDISRAFKLSPAAVNDSAQNQEPVVSAVEFLNRCLKIEAEPPTNDLTDKFLDYLKGKGERHGQEGRWHIPTLRKNWGQVVGLNAEKFEEFLRRLADQGFGEVIEESGKLFWRLFKQ
jgi:hypothetical protein